jgi:hypothetical protein
MPDIAMCEGTNCPVKEKCHRFTAKPSKYQTYFTEAPGEMQDNKFTCKYFWGENAQGIWEQLNNIVKGETK